MKKFRNSGWRFLSKVEEILPSGNSLAHGPASHNPVSSSTQGTTTSTGTSPGGPVGGDVIVIIGDGASHAASVSNLNVTGDGASNMVAAASDDTFGWGQCASALQAASSPEAVAGSSGIPPPLSSASSMGKHSHSDMTLSHSAPPSTTYTSASQMPSDKKPKLSARASSSKLHASAGTSKKAAKEAAGTAAWMNLQGSINHLTNGLTSFATTDESHAADETLRALEVMQNEEDLSVKDKIVLMNAFMLNQKICSTYLHSKPALKLPFLLSIIRQAKGMQL